MLRRATTLVAALVLLVVLAVGGMFLPVPYLVASPGLTLDTVGELDDQPVIRIEGAESYTHEGSLSMVTVQYTGGPNSRMDLLTVLTAWLSPSKAVLPEEALFPPDRTPEEVSETQAFQMEDSQTSATAAALTELGVDYDSSAVVASVLEGRPADGLLEPGDTITAVDGEPVPTAGGRDAEGPVGSEAVVAMVGDRAPGEPVELTVSREGRTEAVELTTEANDEGEAIVGVLVANETDFPVDVDIVVGEIGGPSAGMMFALGIMDRLSEEGITGGHDIAGSGTISADGDVGGVSGIAQKMVSAQRTGAEYFFVASESCPQTFQSAAAGRIEVVRVDTLSEAVDALEAIRAGAEPQELPRCPG